MKFIRDIISEKRAQSAAMAATDAAAPNDGDRKAYVLTPDVAVDDAPQSALYRPTADAFVMLEDDEPESILAAEEGAPDPRAMLKGAERETTEAATYDFDFDDIDLDAVDDDAEDWDVSDADDLDEDMQELEAEADQSEDDAAADDDADDMDDMDAFERRLDAELGGVADHVEAADVAELADDEDDNIFADEAEMSFDAYDFGDADADDDHELEDAEAETLEADVSGDARSMTAGWTGTMPRFEESEAEAEEDTRDTGGIVADLIASDDMPDDEEEAALRPDVEAPAAVESEAAPASLQERISQAALAGRSPEAAPLAAALPPMPETRRVGMPGDSAGQPVDVPAPAAGRANRRAGRVKTRLLGFNSGQAASDPFARGDQGGTETQQFTEFPVGWLIIVDGPGRGSAFTIYNGVAQIGRGEGQGVRLDFGDTSISRENHAAIAYDPEQRKFYLGHGGKANLVRLNNRPVLSTEELENGNLIRIGETTLRFVALCGADFDWSEQQQDGLKHVSVG